MREGDYKDGGEGNSPDGQEAETETYPADWTERASAWWSKRDAHMWALFRGPIWDTRPPMESVRECVKATHGRMELADLLSMATFPDGFGSGRYDGAHHARWANEQWEALDKPERERERLLTRTSVTTLLAREFPKEVQFLGSLVTHTTRMFLVGPTGAGKTMLALAMAGGIVTMQGFLVWLTDQVPRPPRVL
jgi:hypothetical protein